MIPIPEVTVRFQLLSHEVFEGQTARVCIEIIGSTDTVVSVGVSTTPVDAEGEIQCCCTFALCWLFTVDDYGTPVPSQLVFGVGVSNLCTDITTTDDDVHEGNESFLVSLFSTTGNVGNTATVLIIDNDDGMHLLSLDHC